MCALIYLRVFTEGRKLHRCMWCEAELLAMEVFQSAGIKINWTAVAFLLLLHWPWTDDLHIYDLNLTRIYTGCANMNFYVNDFKSYLADRQTNRHADKQTDREIRPKL